MKQLMDSYSAWKKDQTQASLMGTLQAAQPIINTALQTYVGSKDPVAISHARILALRAIKSYDSNRGTQLRTHMLTQMQPLRRLAAQRRFVTHVPEQVQYDLSGIREAEADLSDELGREPTEIELADHTGFSVKRLKHLRQFSIAQPESMFGVEGPPQSEEHNPMDDWRDYVYHDLGPTDQKIFEWRTGYNGKPQLGVSDIAKRLGLSAGRVTQRANDISTRLEEGLSVGRTL